MATRHNACVNPAAKVDVSGWTGAAAPSRVTGLSGMSRTTGARYTSGSFIQMPAGAVSPGDVVTISFDVLTEEFDDPSVNLYFEVNGGTQVGATETFDLQFGVPERVSITRTIPAGGATAFLIVDSLNVTISPTTFTGLLIEVSPTADPYFDGDSPGATWDGTDGLSSSTLTDNNDGVLAGVSPMPTAALTGDVRVDAQLAGSAPLPIASLTGDVRLDGVLAGRAPMPRSALTGDLRIGGVLAGRAPMPIAHLTDTQFPARGTAGLGTRTAASAQPRTRTGPTATGRAS